MENKNKNYIIDNTVTNDSDTISYFKARYKRTTVSESFDEYYEKKIKISTAKSKWIHDIIDGISEQDSILFADDQFILIPTYKWNHNDIIKMHLLGIVKDNTITSIRDLRKIHIPLLKHIRDVSYDHIEKYYGFKSDKLKVYFHYPPSAWLLHIHFVLIENTDSTSSVEYSYDLTQVLFNLEIDSDYYKKIQLNVLNY
jgi:m7GpppX diphosphatase